MAKAGTVTSRRGLRAMVAGAGVSSVGDGAFLAAAPLAAAAVTRDPTAVALVAAAEFLPWVLVAPVAGAYVDRWPRRTTMIVADAARAAALVGLAVSVAMGTASVALIAICAFAVTSGMVFHSAAAEAMIPALTTGDDELHRVNGHIQSATVAGRQLLGPPAGSTLYAAAPWLPFAVDAISFAASAAILRRLPSAPQMPTDHTSVLASIRAGAAYVLANRDLRTMVAIIAIGNLASNITLAILVLYATDPGILAITPAAYGLLLAAMAVGGIAGGAIAPHVIRRLGTWRTFIAAGLVEATGWAGLGQTDNQYAAGVALAACFVAITVVTVVVVGARQQLTPADMLGRVISAFRVVGNGTSPLGALAGGLIAAAWGLRAPMLVAAALLAITVAIAARAQRRDRQN